MARRPATTSTRLRAVGDTATRRRVGRAGPRDVADLDPDLPTGAGTVDFGALRVPVPADGTVAVELPADGQMHAVHVSVAEGRLSMSALAAPRTGKLWPDLAAEIDASLREGGARVRSYSGEWGRELHATTGAATSIFVGVDGPRWMVYGVATGPTRDAVALDARLRRMMRGTTVVRGRSPYPVRTVLPLVVPRALAAAQATGVELRQAGAAQVGADAGARTRGAGFGATARDDRRPWSGADDPAGPGAATAAFVAVVRAARPGPEMSEGVTTESLPVVGRLFGPGPGHPYHPPRVDDLTAPNVPIRPVAPASPRSGWIGNGIPGPASTPLRNGSQGAPSGRPTLDDGVSGRATPGARIGTRHRPDGLVRPPGPSGEELFTPGSPTGPPVPPGRRRPVDVPAPLPGGVRAAPSWSAGAGRHARPELPAWRWPEDRPAPAGGRRAPDPGAAGRPAESPVVPTGGSPPVRAAQGSTVGQNPVGGLPAAAPGEKLDPATNLGPQPAADRWAASDPLDAPPPAGRRRSLDRAGSTESGLTTAAPREPGRRRSLDRAGSTESGLTTAAPREPGRRRSLDRAGSTPVADLLARASRGPDRDAAAGRGRAADGGDLAADGGHRAADRGDRGVEREDRDAVGQDRRLPDTGRHRRPEV